MRSLLFLFGLLVICLPSSAVAERVLFPIPPGAYDGVFSSQWIVTLTVTNRGSERADFLAIGALPFGRSIPPRTTVLDAVFLNHFLWEVSSAADIDFHLEVRNTLSDLGTELPVVRESEFFHGNVSLTGVRIAPRSRTALRVYVLGGSIPVEVSVTVLDPSNFVVAQMIEFLDPNPLVRLRRVTYLDLSNAIQDGDYRVEVSTEPSQDVWAFASITGDASLRVKTVTPQ